ncbi:glycosyl hydrolase [Actinoallomurus sp. NPDC052308]|uniref:glycosyl hydrolase n=1 Tax=Actinoallomurus sp. NPDC052308 TaxID=3155530 RepID=UPI00341F8CDB
MKKEMPADGFSRRGFLLTAGTVAAGAALAWGSPLGEAAARAAGSGTAGSFARPDASVAPKFRWWWPDGNVDPDEIRREVDQIADAGFGGAEIAAVHHSISDKSVLDPAGHGWGTPAWVAAVEAALDQARRRGVTIDLTIGPSWPAAVPTITPDDTAAVKELAYGSATVAAGATYDGPVPPPARAAASTAKVQKLFLVQAARVNTANSTRKETGLDLASVQDLTGKVTDGRLSWTAPSDGSWVIISHWERGSAQTPESGPHTVPAAYVVDHFSAAGTKAVTDYWEEHILTRSVRKLIKKAGATLFEDSIEIETKALMWTPDLPREFERRKGYSVLPYLPAITQDNGNQLYAYEAAATRRIRYDYWDVVSQLFNENHITALQDWAHSVGLEFRCQPYGAQTDAIASAAILDVPEGESIGFHNLDDWRSLAGGRDMAGRKVLSGEMGAYTGGAYNTTWKKFLLTAGGAYAAGLNRSVIHGFSYATAPGVKWPGYAAFTPYSGSIGYAESWGPRQPTWRHIKDISGYLSRVHQVLQTGTPRVDVAVFRQTGYSKTGIGVSWFTATGITLGWNHQFISAPLLDLPNADVHGGRLAPDGPRYKVVFVEGDHFYNMDSTLQLGVAEKLLKFTRAGLPIVLLGDWSAPVVPGLGSDAENARLRAVVADLLKQPKVKVVATTTDVPTALADLGVTPDVTYAQSSTLLNFHRYDDKDDVDYYYLCNGKHAETVKPPVAAIDHQVSFTRTHKNAVPYLLDPWSGEVRRVALYTEDGDTITMRVTLQPGEVLIVALAGPGSLGDASGRAHATGTEAAEVVFADGRLMARATAAGTYATTLSTGRTVRTEIPDVPAPITPASWRLEVEDLQPGASATETETVVHRLTLDSLQPWPSIPELADVSGIGRYTTTVDLPRPWTSAYGACLRLGQVFDTCRVTVNGREVPPVDQINPVVDVGPYLRAGANTITVEVATTLNNRLRVSDPSVYGVASRQAYGLIGPVSLVPYAQAVIA